MFNMSLNGQTLTINYSILKKCLHHIIWNHPSKVHQWKERKHKEKMSTYIIDMKIDNGCWISIPRVQRKFYT